MTKAKKYLGIVIVFVAGLGPLFLGVRDFLNARELAREGKTTVATVVDHDTVFGRKGRVRHYLSVEFTTEANQKLTRRLLVDRSLYERAVAARQVQVYYLPARPAICQAGDRVEFRYGGMLFGGFMLAFGVVLIVLFKQPWDTPEAAEAISEQVEQMCQTQHEYVPADPRKFGHLDIGHYDEGQRRLEAFGFGFLQDVEDLTFRRNCGLRVFVRLLVSRDGAVMAALYHLKSQWLLRALGAKQYRVVDFESQLADGSFVCTSNADAAGALNYPHTIHASFLPAGTPIETVLGAHARNLAGFITGSPGIQPKRFRTIADVQQAQAELTRLKGEFRKHAGISREELQRIAGGSASAELDQIHAAVRLRHEDRQRNAA